MRNLLEATACPGRSDAPSSPVEGAAGQPPPQCIARTRIPDPNHKLRERLRRLRSEFFRSLLVRACRVGSEEDHERIGWGIAREPVGPLPGFAIEAHPLISD